MLFSCFGDNAEQYPSGSFAVSITNRHAYSVKFDNASVFLDNRLLTAQEQKNLLNNYQSVYQIARRRNYGWRFFSFCHDYFNGQLEEIRTLQTDEQKLRYLLYHADKTPHSKTAEALKIVLPIFSNGLRPTLQNTTIAQKKLVAIAVLPESSKEKPKEQSKEKSNIPAPQPLQTDYPTSCMRWVEEACHTLWQYPVIRKAASVQFDGRNWKYDLFFYSDIKTEITKTIPKSYFFSNADTITRETAECEWAKMLYNSLDHFRCRVFHAEGLVSEINAAFNEFIKAIHTDPADLYSAKVASGDFYELAKLQRIQLIAIHTDWLTRMDHGVSSVLTL